VAKKRAAKKKSSSRSAGPRKGAGSKPSARKKGSKIGPGSSKGKTGDKIQLMGETQRGSKEEQIARFKMQALANMGLDESALDPSPGMGPGLLAGLMVTVSCYVGYKIAFS